MKERIVRDPIHGFVSLSDYEFIQKLVNMQYFQRLRRLYQLGVSSFVYPTATHSRLSHSLGATELFGRIFDNLHKRDKKEVEYSRKIGKAAVLLHDIGHGPLSHMSEKIFGFKHEDLTVEIIQNEEVKRILGADGIKSEDVVKIIKQTTAPEYNYISQLISGELDVDRLDYLSRDAYFTGVTFGRIDLERIVRTLEICKDGGELEGCVVSSNKGLEAIESYVLGRHLMYQGVYYHKTTRGFERLMESTFKRAKLLSEESKLKFPSEFDFVTQKRQLDVNDLLNLDDHAVFNLIRQWQHHEDKILNDLASRVINRKPLKSIELDQFAKYMDNRDQINDQLNKNGFEPDYYLLYDQSTETPYSTYSPKGADDNTTVMTNIFVLDEKNQPKEISQLSKVVKALSDTQSSFRIYVPDECKSQTLSILGMDGN